MKHLVPVLFAVSTLSACAGPMVDVEPLPGRISYERQERDSDTCKRLSQHAERKTGFMATVAKECKMAFAQIQDRGTDLDMFDVARAYLDALHDYANAIEFLKAQEEGGRVASDYGAYLIGRQTRLIDPMMEWRYANGNTVHPISLAPKEVFV